MSITQKAMVMNLQIGLWTGQRLDREATRKVTEDNNAANDAARVNKHLIPKDALRDISAAATAIRNHFYEKTLPWKDNGDRLLTRVMYMTFIEEHARLKDDFNHAVKHFLQQGYPSAVEQAGFRMGELFDIADYPAPGALSHKFYVNLDIDAVTEAGDFRVQMDSEQIETIKGDMERAMEQRLAGAMKDVWSRLHKVVGHFADKMSDQDKIFRDSTLHNLEELVEMLPGLNVLDDPDLEAIRADLAQSLGGYSPKDLRKHPEVRSEAAAEAQRIMDTMKGFMSAMGAV